MWLRAGQGLVPKAPRGSVGAGIHIWGRHLQPYLLDRGIRVWKDVLVGANRLDFMEELVFGVSQGESGQARGQCAEECVKQRVGWATGYSLGGQQKLQRRG